ncbi:hypothetical protein CPC16_009182 [Podila verticillata]|nr:hypothetical protein BGZ52_009450 [Haplosporangium bisporale]KAF9214701.1 hypothetical protein BGZ59_003189 [Podila verticillata]KAF9395147.1 hypothetical protein CPC16_009182 [Podila verticillata]KFH71203.1 hypothetical protein MVEG_01505 [Podila verticillata NRRL 6337]
MMRNAEPRGFGSAISAEKPAGYTATGRAPSGIRRRFNDAWKSVEEPALVLYNFLEKNTNLTFWIAVGMVVGILVGQFAPDFAVNIGPMGTVFIRMIQIIVGPLIFTTLVIGIAGQGDNIYKIGRLALKSVIYFEVVTTLALILGIFAVNIAKPGNAFNIGGLNASATIASDNMTINWVTELELIVPTSFFLAMSDHTAVLAVVFCAIMFSLAIMRVEGKSKKFMLDFNASLSEILFKVMELVMNYAPIGIACSIASTVGQYGLSALGSAGMLVATLLVTLIVFTVVVIGAIVFFARLPKRDFARAVARPCLMAFATASSESALPTAMEHLIDFGVSPDIAAFVIPTGYSFNLAGSTLYLAIAVIFCAQVAGIQKSVKEQTLILLTLMLSSKGIAAVPRASIIVLTSSLNSAGIPLAPLALILSVDAFMDMMRTAINLLGNMLAAAVICKWEGDFRNEDWRARQLGQTPEELEMNEPEGDDFGTPLPFNSNPINPPLHNNIGQNRNHSQSDQHSPRTDQFFTHEFQPQGFSQPIYGPNADAVSLRSVHSVRSVNSNASYDLLPTNNQPTNSQPTNSFHNNHLHPTNLRPNNAHPNNFYPAANNPRHHSTYNENYV